MDRPIPPPTAAAVVGPWLSQIIGAGSVDADPLQLGQELAAWRRGGPVPDLPPGVTLPAELVALVIAERPAGAAAAVPAADPPPCPEVARINRNTDRIVRSWRRISRRRDRQQQGQAKPLPDAVTPAQIIAAWCDGLAHTPPCPKTRPTDSGERFGTDHPHPSEHQHQSPPRHRVATAA